MNRRTIRIALIAVVCLVALSVTAATIDSTRNDGGSGSGLGSGPGSGAAGPEQPGSNGTSQQQQQQQGSTQQLPTLCVDVLRNPLAVIALLGGTVAALGVVTRRYNAPFAFGLAASFIPPGILVYGFLTTCNREYKSGSPSATANNTTLANGSGSQGAFRGAVAGQSEVPIMFAIVMVLVTLVGLFVVVRGTDSNPDDPDPEAEAPPGEASTVEAIGEAAGDAADRIDAAGDVDNEVYRAWREMVTQLDVGDPDSMTPGEFADAAVDAGMARRDVEELTDLFETVRYGGFDPTDDRERRALDALRRIEREYAEDDR